MSDISEMVGTGIKSIRSMADLAINGAPPAFPQAIHVGRPNIGCRDSFLAKAHGILDRRWLTNNGPMVLELEQRLCEMLQVKHVILMCNATVAMEIAIRALDLHGEVIVPSYTFIATAHALLWQGITPVFADIDPKTHALDPSSVERLITSRTTGIIGVHLWGKAANIHELERIAKSRGLKVLYDAAHAFGCTHEGRHLANFGEAEVFSFHATKFFNTFEGGAVTTNNDQLAQKLRYMRNFGFAGFDNVIHLGTNGKMAEMSAAMGLTNLEYLPTVVSANRYNYETYRQQLTPISGVSLFSYDEHEVNNWQYIVLELDDELSGHRDSIVSALHAENILARRYFWPGCHRMQPYREMYPNAELMLPNTTKVADRVIVLPTGTTLPDQVPRIVAELVSQFARQWG